MSAFAEFTVLGEPKGQPRPRAFARKMGDKYVARVYNAATAEGWKSAIAAEAARHRFAAPLTGPIKVLMLLQFLRPKSQFRTGKRAAELRPDAPYFHIKKPDSDNVAKAGIDALTQIGGFWLDDCQVCRLSVHKTYAEPGCSGRTTFQIEEIEGTP